MSIVIFSGQPIIVPLDQPADPPLCLTAPIGVPPDITTAIRRPKTLGEFVNFVGGMSRSGGRL